MKKIKLSYRQSVLIQPVLIYGSILLMAVIFSCIIAVNGYAKSSTFTSTSEQLSGIAQKKSQNSISQSPNPTKIKAVKHKPITKQPAESFLEIRKVYVPPKDNNLRIVIQNSGQGALSKNDYRKGRLEIKILGASTRWRWPLAKLTNKKDHFVSETTFNTNKIITETIRLKVEIKGVKSGKPWIGSIFAPGKLKKSKKAINMTALGTSNSLQADSRRSSVSRRPLPKKDMIIKSKNGHVHPIPATPGSSEMIPRSDSPPYLKIENVYRHQRTGHLHVVMRNTGRDEIDVTVYSELGLNIEGLGNYPQFWFFEQVDPAHTLLFDSLDFDTRLPVPEEEKVRVYFTGIAGDRFSGVPGHCSIGDFRVITPRVDNTVSYDDPLDINWVIPAAFDNGDTHQPSATFKVELLKNGRIIEQIDSARYRYHSPTNLCTLSWPISHHIVTGSDYKIKITLNPMNPYDYGGSYTAVMPGVFSINTLGLHGSSHGGFRIHNPAVVQRYTHGERIEVNYSYNSDHLNAHLADYIPQMVKISLSRVGGGKIQEWLEYVPEPVSMSHSNGSGTMLITSPTYVNTITIPEEIQIPARGFTSLTRLTPGTYHLSIRDANPQYAHLGGATSGHFTIYDDGKKQIHGIKDGRISDPIGIVSPGVPVESWNLDREQVIEWTFDPDLEVSKFSIAIDMSLNGGDILNVPEDNIRIMAHGRDSARFTIPRDFNPGKMNLEQYANIRVDALLPARKISLKATRTVRIYRTINVLDFSNTLSINAAVKIQWRDAREGHAGIALKRGGRVVKIIDHSRRSIRGENELTWCVLCDVEPEEHSELAVSGYTIRVYRIENPGIYDESAPFTIQRSFTDRYGVQRDK